MKVIQSQQSHTFGLRTFLALSDLWEGITGWRIWLRFAWQDIRLRYRRSMIGPFWITFSMAITIGMTGLLYGALFHMQMERYFPYFASGMLVWSLISTSIMESSNIFFESEHFLKQMKFPFSFFIFKSIAKNFIIFLHNIVIFIPVIFIFHVPINANTLIFLYGLLLIVTNIVCISTTLAVCGTRFRDIGQLVNSLTQVIFFLTPIIWSEQILPAKYRFVVDLNPFALLLEIVRDPLMGIAPSYYALSITLALTIINAACAFLIFARFRARISYWL